MNRRTFIAGLGSAAAWPLVARGQQAARLRRIGILMNTAADDPVEQARLATFIDGMRQLGWTEGQNLQFDVRWNAGDAELAATYAAELIKTMPDAVVAISTVNLTAIRQATSVVPVVFLRIADPVAQGFVANISQPGGNLTGFSLYEFSFGAKWLDLLRRIAPGLKRAVILFNPKTAPYWKFFKPVIDPRPLHSASKRASFQLTVSPTSSLRWQRW